MPLIQLPCLTFHGDAGFPKGQGGVWYRRAYFTKTDSRFTI